MLMIRLQRFGRKNDPSFRVVLTDKRNATKSGKFLEILGFKNPKTKEKKLDAERIKYWISKGAKTSPTVHNMLISEKIVEGKKINVVPVPKLKEEIKTEENLSKEENNSSPQPHPLIVRGGGEEGDGNLPTGGGVIIENVESIPIDKPKE